MDIKRIKVLLVEDDPDNRDRIQNMLARGTGAVVDLICASRLSSALDLLAGHRLDLLLMNLDLMDSHGLETFTAIQTHAPGLPIIVLTQIDNDELAVRAVRRGAQDYLAM